MWNLLAQLSPNIRNAHVVMCVADENYFVLRTRPRDGQVSDFLVDEKNRRDCIIYFQPNVMS